MTSQPLDVGITFPMTEIGVDSSSVRDFAQAAEDLGFGHIVAYDRLLGVNPVNRPEWSSVSPYTHESTFQEPLVLFSYLAGVTRRLQFVPGVIVLPQRQTLLFAKQAANLDRYCDGRLRIGVAIGQNPIEYEVMGVPFKRRAVRMEDQIHFLRRLWSEPWFSETSEFHQVTEAGINPLPLQQPIPLWLAGHAPQAIDRAARIGDGMMCYLSAAAADQTIGKFRDAVKKHGRDPERVRVENFIFVGAGGKGVESAAAEVDTWRKAGAREVNLHTMDAGLRGTEQHVALLRELAKTLELVKR